MEEQKKTITPWWQPGMQLFLRLSGWIGGPIIVAVFLGKYLDRRYHSEPWLFLATVGIAFVISMIALIAIGFKEFKKIEKEAANEKLDKENK
ncbi:MAG: AtpZ/AtpI family protein [Candidatus Moranbacteria bacterium]|nr:AtpZ/AtpI family protein [Candidatus Moranbacteria bacterium]